MGRRSARLPNTFTQVVERTEAERPPGPQIDVFLVDEPMPLEREDVITLTQSVSVGWGRDGARGHAAFGLWGAQHREIARGPERRSSGCDHANA
jgi:hypothetical protein